MPGRSGPRVVERLSGQRAAEVLRGLDTALLRLARTRGHTPQAERLIASFSRMGEHGAVWVAIGAAGYLVSGGGRARWRQATLAAPGAYALNTTLKLAVHRRRPELRGLPALTGTPTRLSFPSAHASTSFAGALAFSRVGLPKSVLYSLAASLSLSRVYLGVHYPSDILAGALLGTGVGALLAPSPVAHRARTPPAAGISAA